MGAVDAIGDDDDAFGRDARCSDMAGEDAGDGQDEIRVVPGTSLGPAGQPGQTQPTAVAAPFFGQRRIHFEQQRDAEFVAQHAAG